MTAGPGGPVPSRQRIAVAFLVALNAIPVPLVDPPALTAAPRPERPRRATAVEAMAARVVEAVNGIRRERGRDTLARDPTLTRVAR